MLATLTPIDPVFWREGYFKVFISHISMEKDFATKLQSELLNYQIAGFVAHADIRPTREWENEILQALKSSDALIALMHKDFHQSSWTDQEIGIAIGHDLLTVSISLGENPYGFIGRYQALAGNGKSPQDLAAELFQIFITHPQSRRRMAEALVNKFANSSSFDEAKKNMTILESLEYWDDNLSSLAQQAIKTNDQLENAWDVPERLDNLIHKWNHSSDDDIPF
jgi:hypothetical protein